MTTAPRIGPGSRREIGAVNALIAGIAGRVAGTEPPRLFTTLGRHRRLFRRWLWFAAALMPRGRLPRADTELVILRVAHNRDCAYERAHHERLARATGLDADDVARVAAGPDAEGWSERQRLLLLAADDLHESGRIGAGTWDSLRAILDDASLIELCMLVGHYEMLAGTINTLGIEPDAVRGAPGA